MSKKYSVIFISILIFWLIFAPKAAIIPNTTISGWISNSISLFLLWYVRNDLKYIFVGKNKTFNFLLLTYLAIAVYSVYYNADTIHKFELSPLPDEEEQEELPEGITSIRYLLYFSIGLLASSLYIQRISRTKYIRTLLKTFVVLFLMVLIPTYVEVFTTPVEVDGDLTEYTIGNKFSIGYYHIYLCTVFYFLYPFLNRIKYKFCLLCFVVMMIVSSMMTQCSTMFMAAFVFMFLSLFASDSLRNHLASAKVIVISVIVLNLGFFYLVTWLMDYDIVQHIIQDVLNRDLSLTGRIHIYMDIQEAFTESPWIGLGYGNSLVVSYYFTDAYDSQNGLVELFIQIGLVGVVLFLLLLYSASKRLEKNEVAKFSFVAFLYTILVISTVEIPFKHTFVFFLSFCFIQEKGYPKALLKPMVIERLLLKIYFIKWLNSLAVKHQT